MDELLAELPSELRDDVSFTISKAHLITVVADRLLIEIVSCRSFESIISKMKAYGLEEINEEELKASISNYITDKISDKIERMSKEEFILYKLEIL